MGPGWVVSAIGASTAGRLDLDDAVHLGLPALAGRGPLTRWLYAPQQASRLLPRANAIVVASPELARTLPAGLVPAHVLPTVPDPSNHVPVTHGPRRPARIG